jgi:hypothetical protein
LVTFGDSLEDVIVRAEEETRLKEIEAEAYIPARDLQGLFPSFTFLQALMSYTFIRIFFYLNQVPKA